jgi:hypothetical protein
VSLVVPAGFDAGQLVACVERELGMRRRVYPGWIARGRMSEENATREISTMTAVLTVLEQLSRPIAGAMYVVESLASGWTCRATGCGVWNGDEKEARTACRSCASPRPHVSGAKPPPAQADLFGGAR